MHRAGTPDYDVNSCIASMFFSNSAYAGTTQLCEKLGERNQAITSNEATTIFISVDKINRGFGNNTYCILSPTDKQL